MVKIPGLDHYHFCEKEIKVYSIRNGKIREVKPIKNAGKKSYRLSKNGVKETISLWDIILKSIRLIEDLKKEAF